MQYHSKTFIKNLKLFAIRMTSNYSKNMNTIKFNISILQIDALSLKISQIIKCSVLSKKLQRLSKWSSFAHPHKCFDFMFQLHLYKCLELLKPLKPLSFGFHLINPHLSLEIINKYFSFPWPCFSWSLKHSNAQSLRVLLLTLDAHFANQCRGGMRDFTQVHAPQHALQCINAPHIQMLCMQMHNIGYICSAYLNEDHLIQIPFALCYCNHIFVCTS